MALLDAVAPKKPGWRRHAAAFAFLIAIGTLVIAFAKPTHDEKVPRERATVIVAIDTSLSMEANDITPTRIDAVKTAATSFVNQLPPKINLGVVAFDGNARLVVAPTTDRSKARTAIKNLDLNEGTAIGEAIFTSIDAIKQTVTVDDSGQKIPARIVLMSDGKTTVGRSNDDAVAAAKKANIPVSTIAFGTDHGEITVPESPQPIAVPVDKEALQVDRPGDQRLVLHRRFGQRAPAGLHGHRLVDRLRPRADGDHHVVRRHRPRRPARDRGDVPRLVLPTPVVRHQLTPLRVVVGAVGYRAFPG